MMQSHAQGLKASGLSTLLTLGLLFWSSLFTLANASPLAVRQSATAIDGTQMAPLSASGRFIVDANGKRVKLRCVNWAAHLETLIPEGLQHRALPDIISFIAGYGFNCVRMSYSIDYALNLNTQVSDAFAAAGKANNVDLSPVLAQAIKLNSFLDGATVSQTHATVLDALGAQGIRVFLDNHVSKAGSCCSTTDGNGWWSSASGFNSANSQNFDTNSWLSGVQQVASLAKWRKSVVGFGLRNELRAVGTQDGNKHADWYNFTQQAAGLIHQANPNMLISFGGVNFETDLSFIQNKPLNTGAWGGSSRTMYESHIFSTSGPGLTTSNCNTLSTYANTNWGYLLTKGKAFTGPLWVSEFGPAMNGNGTAAQGGLSEADFNYVNCFRQFMEANDADWALRALQGDYYVKDGVAGKEETNGVLNKNWQAVRNPKFHDLLGKMWNVTLTS